MIREWLRKSGIAKPLDLPGLARLTCLWGEGGVKKIRYKLIHPRSFGLLRVKYMTICIDYVEPVANSNKEKTNDSPWCVIGVAERRVFDQVWCGDGRSSCSWSEDVALCQNVDSFAIKIAGSQGKSALSLGSRARRVSDKECSTMCMVYTKREWRCIFGSEWSDAVFNYSMGKTDRLTIKLSCNSRLFDHSADHKGSHGFRHHPRHASRHSVLSRVQSEWGL